MVRGRLLVKAELGVNGINREVPRPEVDPALQRPTIGQRMQVHAAARYVQNPPALTPVGPDFGQRMQQILVIELRVLPAHDPAGSTRQLCPTLLLGQPAAKLAHQFPRAQRLALRFLPVHAVDRHGRRIANRSSPRPTCPVKSCAVGRLRPDREQGMHMRVQPARFTIDHHKVAGQCIQFFRCLSLHAFV